MQRREPFIHKLLGRLEKLDRESVQSYLAAIAKENSTFHEILEALGEGVILTNAKGRLIYANRQASLWTGIKAKLSDQALLSESLTDSELSKFITARLSTLKERLTSDIQVLIPREMVIRVILFPLQKQTDEKEILILLSDISRFVSDADENLSRMKALSSLAAGIAHEIGNPLNAITIHLELLKKEIRTLPETKQKNFEKTLNVINAETARLDRIVRHFLKATRKPPLRFKYENLNQILEETIRFMEPELKGNGISLTFRPDKNLPEFLMDRERLSQAFMNLIKNAQESMPGGGNLRVTVSQKDSTVSVSFKDQGSGIAENDLPHIFESYYTTKEEGSGLGLMTVYNVVREHGGRIDVTSKTGKGTLFILHLPIRQPKLQLPQ